MDRLEFAQRWKREIVHTSYVPLARADIVQHLADCVDRLIGELTGASPPGAALDVGAELVQIHFTNPEVLSRTLRLFAADLPALVPGLRRDRLFTALGDLAAGFAGRLREQTFDEQEVIKQAVLHARDAAEEALRASEARFRAVFTASALGIAVVTRDGVIEEVNAAMTRIFRRAEADLVGAAVFELVDDEWLDALTDVVTELAAGDAGHGFLETRFTASDGAHVWTRLSASLVRDAGGEPGYLVLLYEDITDRHMLQEQFRRQATHDPLTGLANRTQLQTSLDEALERTHPGRRVGLCYFDLDGFKAVNDSLGHPIGDRLLRQVAQRLEVVTQDEGALAARMGGDEFVVLVPDSQGATAVVDLVERLLREITRPVLIGSHELSASASVGIVEREVDGTDADALLRDADITLYRAKRDGRAQWVLFDPERNAAARHRFWLSAALPAALDQNELFVEYEPVQRLETGKLVAVCANVRWDHEEFGELGADRFVEVAEETGLITRLGSWVLEQVCRHAARWAERLGDDAPVAAVNLSVRHCRDPELVADVQGILRRTGLPPRSLALCLPERALFDHQGDPVDTLEIFAEMGIRLVVYEFGGDYRGVGRLRHLPLSGIRIDGPHLDRLAEPTDPDPLDEHLVRCAVGAAQLMDFPVIAGGVRTELQARRLREFGVSLVQGPYAGELASALEIEQIVAASR
ncbi:GGDEF domain-containing protein [Saccharopolyspora subtropica]|uniref:Cyclic Di-GMP phosphodiesterase RmdA n=1 Tax=Saccharopolyspora thermophila TaxID=89367 RepID=A0A917K2V6_9PSEU|nr:GGDEF domain-containing protein [Saccharopolyspora subtropica]